MEFLGGVLLKLMSKSGALATNTIMTMSRFELSVSQPRNAIYFSIITIPKKSHLIMFAIQNFVQNAQKTSFFSVYDSVSAARILKPEKYYI